MSRLIRTRALLSSSAALLAFAAAPAFAQDQRRPPIRRPPPTLRFSPINPPTPVARATSSSPRAAARNGCSTCRSRSPPSPPTQLEQSGAIDLTDLQNDHAQHHAEGRARHQFDAHRLHPRRRPAGSGARFRGGRRHLSRRRLSQPARRPRCSTSTTSSGSRCCAGRRARSMGATRSAARSNMSRRGCPISSQVKAKATYGSYNQADGVVVASARRSATCSASARRSRG